MRIPAPERRLDEYPHQLSGGMRQRVMIAMALACDPKVLIADEPTTALDVTIQAGILDLMRDIRERLGTAIVLITHNLGVVADIADRVLVMYAGRKAEEAPVDDLFAAAAAPVHDRPARRDPAAVRGRRRAPPAAGDPRPRAVAARAADERARSPTAVRAPTSSRAREIPELREVRPDHSRRLLPPGPERRRVSGTRPGARGRRPGQALPRPAAASPAAAALVHAVDGVSFALARGEMLGLVGESGSGKSTVANCVLRLIEPTSGTIRLNGTDITHLSRRQMRPLRRELHMVFQDPYSSLNPRMTCGDIVGEPLRLHRLAQRPRARRARRPDLRRGRAADASCATATRTSSPAGSASASASRAR